MRYVVLDGARGIGLILSVSSGTTYTSQAGGYACFQKSEEGIYVPMSDDVCDQEAILRQHFVGPKWLGGCAGGIDAETSNFIDEVMRFGAHSKMITVDRSRMDDSMEAWVYIDVADQPPEPPLWGEYDPTRGEGRTPSGKTWRFADYAGQPVDPLLSWIYGFGPCKGVLVWCNSD